MQVETLKHIPKIGGLKRGQLELYNLMKKAESDDIQFSKEDLMCLYMEFVKPPSRGKFDYKERPLQTQEHVYQNCMRWFERTIVVLITKGYIGLNFRKGIIDCEKGIPPLKPLESDNIMLCEGV